MRVSLRQCEEDLQEANKCKSFVDFKTSKSNSLLHIFYNSVSAMMIREKERSAQASRDTVMKKIKLLEASMTYSDVGVPATTEEDIGMERTK